MRSVVRWLTLGLFVMLAAADDACPCSATVDPAVLYQLYEYLNGPSWQHSGGWSSFNVSNPNASNVCEWYGVSCNQMDRTIDVTLDGNNATGYLPAGLGQLGSSLGALWIEDPKPSVTGVLPPEWGALTAVTTLVLIGAFEGFLPTEWANMTSLVSLTIGPGLIAGSIPEAWCALTQLQQLAIARNVLSGVLPSCLPTAMKGLMAIDVSYNQLNGPLPDSFAEAKLLRHFTAGSNFFTNSSFPAWFGKLPSIASIDLSGTSYTGPLPKEWGNATSLRVISLGNTYINDVIPESWAALPQLYSVQMVGSSVNGPLPRHWASTELRYLSLRNNNITGPLPEFHSSVPLHVDLGYNLLSGPIPLSYQVNTTFEHLDLSQNNLGGTPDLCAIESHAPDAMLVYNNFTGRVADLSCFGPKAPCSNQTLLTQYLEGNSFCGFCTLPPCP